VSLGLAALLWTTQAEAQHVSLDIRDGGVTLDARGVTVAQILAEWARVGGVKVINAEKIGGSPVTLLLRDVNERQALEVLLREAGGYLLFARREGNPGTSVFEQILVVPVSRTPQALPPATGGRADLAPFRRQGIGTIAGVPRTAPPAQAAPGGDQSEVERASAEAADAQDASDDLTGAEPSEVGARPPTPSLPPPPPPPDPGNPFGSAGATSRPGVAAPPPGPPPGVVYPPVTNPNVQQQGPPPPILR